MGGVRIGGRSLAKWLVHAFLWASYTSESLRRRERLCLGLYGLCGTEPFGLFSAYALNKVTHMQEIRFSVALCIYTHIYIYIGLPGLLGGALPSERKGHVRSAVVFCFRGHGAAEGKLQPYAVFGGGSFPHAGSLPGPGLLRTARPGRLGAVTLPQGPPLRKELVESVTMIPRGQPLWVGYAWDVRALGAQPYACGVCGSVDLGQQHICVQRCNEVKHFVLKF